MEKIKMICAYCGVEFVTNNHRKLYCKPSHRIRASELRNGKAPDHFLGDDYDVVQKEKKVTKLNPEYIRLQSDVADLQNQRDLLNKNRNELLYKINNLKVDYKQNFGAFIGGGITTVLLSIPKAKEKPETPEFNLTPENNEVKETTENNDIKEKPKQRMENKNHKTLGLGEICLIVGGAYLGSRITKRSDEEKAQINRLIIQYQEEIRKIDEEIKPINQQLIIMQFSLLHTAKELVEIQVLEIKVPKQKAVEETNKTDNAPNSIN